MVEDAFGVVADGDQQLAGNGCPHSADLGQLRGEHLDDGCKLGVTRGNLLVPAQVDRWIQAKAFEGREDLFCGCGPDEWLEFFVPRFHSVTDVDFEGLDAAAD